MNLLYIVPNLKKVSGGPLTRISMFKEQFHRNGGIIVEKGNKITKSFSLKKIELIYVESATNRISAVDLFSLIFLRARSKKIIVFIRDIYVELFPEEYRSPRKRITFFLNRLSYFFLTLIADKLVFPTEQMGEVFFQKNKWFPKRPYAGLPPGCKFEKKRNLPDFSKKLGILYLGSISYSNSGFEHYLNFSNRFQHKYNFFVLSGDRNIKKIAACKDYISADKVSHSKIPEFIQNHNIAVALHTRPRNNYDDITFPIKVLDFISFQLPFLSNRHVPLIDLLGSNYCLFADINDYDALNEAIEGICFEDEYLKVINMLGDIALNNSYEKRYLQLF